MRPGLPLGVACLLLGACVQPTAGPPGDTPEPPSVDAAFAKIAADQADLPCDVNSVPRDASSANVASISDLPVDATLPPRTSAETDRQDDLIVQAFYTDEGFRLLNVSDPAEPQPLGQYNVNDGSDTYDVKFSKRDPNVVVGFKDRVHLVDVSDPASPKLLSELRHPTGYSGQAHMITTHVVNDTEYLFVTPSVSGSGLLVEKITGRGHDAKLEPVRLYPSSPLAPHAVVPQALAPHDTFAEFDEVYGHHVLYLANSFNGVVIMNIDDPADAKTIASLPGNQAPPPTGAAPNHYHTIQSTWIGDRRIFVTVSEVGYNTMKIFDATDLENPKFMGEWIYDRNQPANLQHNFQIVDGKILMAHYEQGLFVFDLAAYVKDPSKAIEPIAHYQPPPGGLLWDVLVWNGVLFLSDIPQGLHVLGYGCFTPGDATLDSRG